MTEIFEAVSRVILAPGSGTSAPATSALTSSNLDCAGIGHAHVSVNVGKSSGSAADPVTVELQQSNDTVVSNFGAILGTGTVTNCVLSITPNTSNGQQARFEVNMRGMKRYLRVIVTPGTSTATGTSSDAVSVSASALLFRPGQSPLKNSMLADGVAIIAGGVQVA